MDTRPFARKRYKATSSPDSDRTFLTRSPQPAKKRPDSDRTIRFAAFFSFQFVPMFVGVKQDMPVSIKFLHFF